MTILTINDYTIALWQTIYTVLISSSISITIGLCLGSWLNHLEPNKHKTINKEQQTTQINKRPT